MECKSYIARIMLMTTKGAFRPEPSSGSQVWLLAHDVLTRYFHDEGPLLFQTRRFQPFYLRKGKSTPLAILRSSTLTRYNSSGVRTAGLSVALDRRFLSF